MERNLGFFEAWRAKRKEKKNEELERLSAVRVETGVLSKYLKLRSQEVGEGLNSFGERPSVSEISKEKEKEVTKAAPTVIESRDSAHREIEKNDVSTGERVSKEASENSNQSSGIAKPVDGRRSSFDSRRGSVNTSLVPLTSIQDRILTLAQEQNICETEKVKKMTKVNKLSEEVFRVGKFSPTEGEENIKSSPKIKSDLQTKVPKLGTSSAASTFKKPSEENNTQKGIRKKTITIKGSKTSKVENAVAENSITKQDDMERKTGENSDAVKNCSESAEPEAKKKKENSTESENAEGVKVNPELTLSKNETVNGGDNKIEKKPEKNAGVSQTKPACLDLGNKSQERKSEKMSMAKPPLKKSDANSKKETESAVKTGLTEAKKEGVKASTCGFVTEPLKSVIETCKKHLDPEAAKSELQKKPSLKIVEGVKKATVKPELLKKNSNFLSKNAEEIIKSEAELGVSSSWSKKAENGQKSTNSVKENLKGKLLDEDFEKAKSMSSSAPDSLIKSVKTSTSNENLQREVIEEAVKVQENVTLLTNRAKQMEHESLITRNNQIFDDRSEGSCVSQESGNDSLRLKKDPKKVQRKTKSKSGPDECYPKTQKLLTNKPMNPFEQTKLEESKKESVVSPRKVEAFLREALSPPTLNGDKEPVKTMEAVVEEIFTSTSEKSRHEKPSKVKYTSRGEVICGVVSIKPSSKEEDDGLSAITLVPAFRPETSVLEKEKNERTSDYFSESSFTENARKVERPIEISEKPQPVHEEPDKSGRACFSPISDFSDDSYDHYVASVDYSFDSSYSRRRSLRSSSTPRRIFPQIVKPSPYRIDRTKEESPVVFDAGLSFDIGSHRTSLRHRFKAQPAFTDLKTNSSSLSMRISDFLKRTDHIMDEWKHLGKGGEGLQDLVQVPSSNSSKSKSATNIMIKGLLNYSKGSRTPSLRSRSFAKTSEASDRTISDIDELSEMTLDLSEERATGTMQAERLEAETAERVRLEQELAQVQSEKKNLQQTSERLEMELFYARADVNGLSESEADLEDGGGDAALYKNKCERAMRELEFTRRRLQQQHEDDLEQLVALKKQLEKKLADAYEEVEEQRQVAAQWKRKVQKLQSEMNDLRLLLEEQSSRNNLLEKKQRKFDSEIQMLQEELRSEKSQKERASREREMAVAEKYSLEQNLSSVRLELELKEEKVSALSRELEELSRGGGTEQEVTQLRKAKHDLEMKLKEQEEELDELAGQVSMLEGNKLRLEMSLESLRKEHRREMAQRDDELDEVRANGQKKIKVLESQLESEHEERTLLVREKHELERRLADAEERGRHHRAADEDALQRARRDLKKTKALLRDAQIMLERVKQDSPSKAALRALKNQLEDAELARASIVKAKQSLEAELNEVTGQLEEALRAKGDAENRCQSAVREMNSLRTQVDENEEELAELLKKYRQTVQQLSAEQLANQETAGALAEAEAERSSLRDQLAELTARLEANAVVDPMSGLAQKKLEIRLKELENRLELEQTTRGRLEVQITRLKENVERLNEECVQARTKEQAATDLTRKLQRSLREAKEELAAHQGKEQEAAHKRKELEKRLEAAEVEASTAKTDLRLAVKRIEDLQSAISGEIGTDSERTDTEEEDSENDSLVSHVPSTISSTSRTSRTPELTPR